LDSIFKNKIIPLLQEYFYDDWEKIQIVLGDHDGQFDNRYKYLKNKEEDHRFIISHALKEIDVLGFDHGTSEESKTSYLVNAEFTANAYLKITGQLKSEITVNAKQPS
jgi:5-methylcytosine-specific restriction protein B